ncbi:hypothetical protein [Massilia aquatica]|uniref:DUF983 domain-containing protein n=1 Tax=Massilia aquatica TaxID=2609000 RepID=A0ABX0MCT0_9BURK|nr:hypothetical protein [Massilia aquatica]NHZ44877.1 hypothetical protein [Massilia aquatica]
MNIDGVPVSEMECPQCGATKWRHFDIPGNTRLQHQLLLKGKTLISGSFAVFVAASYLFIFSALQELGFIAVGIFLCLAPLSLLVIRLTDHIRSTLHLCESCGFFSSE